MWTVLARLGRFVHDRKSGGRGETAHSATIKKSSASLLPLFGLRPACSSGLFGSWGNRRRGKLRRLVFLTPLDLAAQDCALFEDHAAPLHIACHSASPGNLESLA